MCVFTSQAYNLFKRKKMTLRKVIISFKFIFSTSRFIFYVIFSHLKETPKSSKPKIHLYFIMNCKLES